MKFREGTAIGMQTWLFRIFSVMLGAIDSLTKVLNNADPGYLASEIHRKEIDL